MLRKKLFRFEYGAEEAQEDVSMIGTPTKISGILSSPAKPVRRRASHRMSLVPSNADFVPHSPAKARRHSLGNRGPSALSLPPSMPETVEEGVEADETVVEVVRGDDGDQVFVERKDESHPSQQIQQPIYNNAFMTPQQKQKAPLRNTSAVPRTRKMQTAPSTPPKIHASLALTTPRGSSSLRKSLLVHSARQTWKDTQSPGIEGAIENGDVQIRRRSSSPRVARSKSPSLSPEASDEEMDGEEHHGELQWVQEDGQAHAAAVDSDSDANDSFEADASLDIVSRDVLAPLTRQPGAGVLDLSPLRIKSEDRQDEAHDGDRSLDPEQDEWSDEDEDMVEGDDDDQGNRQDDDSMVDVDHPPLPGTPAAARQLSRFYTPQPRGMPGQPRRSMLGIGGSAVRFRPSAPLPNFAATPIKFHPRASRASISIGKPSRLPSTPVSRTRSSPASSPFEQEYDDDEEKPSLTTPGKEALRAEVCHIAPDSNTDQQAKRRRETLATPRALPAPPASGFKSMARQTPLVKLGTPSHPALEAQSPEAMEAPGVPSTPLNDIKRRLGDLRRQSLVANAGRRATLGFALPSTPASRSTSTLGGSYTVTAASKHQYRMPHPQTPLSEEEEADVEDEIQESPVPLPSTPVTSLRPLAQNQESPSPAVDASFDSETEVANQLPVPPTPSFAGLREMLKPRPPPQTPNFSGLRQMFPPAPAPAQTPSFTGVKQLLAQPAVPATPNFVGMRQMYTIPQKAASPVLEGIGETLAALEGEWEDDEEEAERGKEVQQESEGTSRPTRRAASKPSTSARTRRAASKPEQNEEASNAKVPAKRTRTTKAPAVEEDNESASAPSKSSRTRRATTKEPSAEPETRSVSSRSRRTPTAEPEAPKPSRRTRSADPTPEVEEAPSRSTRSRVAKVKEEVVLSEVAEHPEEAEAIQEVSKPSKRRTATKTAAASETSGPSRRSRQPVTTNGGKENQPDGEKDETNKVSAAKKTVRKAPTSSAATAEPTSVSTRSTRSRK